MNRALEWTFAAIGTAICFVGALAISAQQQQVSAPGESLWPLPGIVLAEWMLLGMVGFVGIGLDRPNGPLFTWGACGGLVALMIMGAFSIGPLVFVAAIFLVGAAIAASLRRSRNISKDLATLGVGFLINLALIAVVVVVFQQR